MKLNRLFKDDLDRFSPGPMFELTKESIRLIGNLISEHDSRYQVWESIGTYAGFNYYNAWGAHVHGTYEVWEGLSVVKKYAKIATILSPADIWPQMELWIYPPRYPLEGEPKLTLTFLIEDSGKMLELIDEAYKQHATTFDKDLITPEMKEKIKKLWA